MWARIAKWAAIALLVLSVAWLSFQWGVSVTEAQTAEARTAAVAEARREAEQRLQKAVDKAQERAQQYAQRTENLEDRVRDLQSAADRYAESEAGGGECFGEDGTEAWNEL